MKKNKKKKIKGNKFLNYKKTNERYKKRKKNDKFKIEKEIINQNKRISFGENWRKKLYSSSLPKNFL